MWTPEHSCWLYQPELGPQTKADMLGAFYRIHDLRSSGTYKLSDEEHVKYVDECTAKLPARPSRPYRMCALVVTTSVHPRLVTIVRDMTSIDQQCTPEVRLTEVVLQKGIDCRRIR